MSDAAGLPAPGEYARAEAAIALAERAPPPAAEPASEVLGVTHDRVRAEAARGRPPARRGEGRQVPIRSGASGAALVEQHHAVIRAAPLGATRVGSSGASARGIAAGAALEEQEQRPVVIPPTSPITRAEDPQLQAVRTIVVERDSELVLDEAQAGRGVRDGHRAADSLARVCARSTRWREMRCRMSGETELSPSLSAPAGAASRSAATRAAWRSTPPPAPRPAGRARRAAPRDRARARPPTSPAAKPRLEGLQVGRAAQADRRAVVAQLAPRTVRARGARPRPRGAAPPARWTPRSPARAARRPRRGG